MSNARDYKPTKLVLWGCCRTIIEKYRIPGMSDDAPGRRSGSANADEMAGANDILYHLMCTDSIAFMAKELGVSRQRMFDALDLCMHRIDGEKRP